MDETDRAILMQVQDGLPLVEEPFAVVAEKVGISDTELIGRLERLRSDGSIRRFGARINNRRCGFVVNAMIAWNVPEEKVDMVGRLFASSAEVTHCYERRVIPGRWDYNVFTMIHCRSDSEVEELVARLAAASGVDDYQVLTSGEEFKRTVSVRITDEGKKVEAV